MTHWGTKAAYRLTKESAGEKVSEKGLINYIIVTSPKENQKDQTFNHQPIKGSAM